MYTKMLSSSHLILVCFLGFAMTQEVTESPKINFGDMATEIISRSAGSSSQVLSLNLSNLGILVLLKALIFGAFYLGGDKYKGRSLEEEDYISEQELLLVLSYLMGEADHDYGCLHRIACQDPKKSKKYLAAAKFLIKWAKVFENVVPIDDKYETLVENLQEAVNFGIKYKTCEQRYTCRSKAQSS